MSGIELAASADADKWNFTRINFTEASEFGADDFRYRLVSILPGASGTTWKARDLKAEDAIKAHNAKTSRQKAHSGVEMPDEPVPESYVVLKIATGDISRLKRSDGEAEALRKIAPFSENVVRLARPAPVEKDVCFNLVGVERRAVSNPQFIVLEYLEDAQTLDNLREKASESLAQEYAETLFSLLVALEKTQLIHRDISLSNLLVDRHNKLWLVDFEHCLFMDRDSLESDDDLLSGGTSGFAAPEVSTFSRKITATADQFSVARVLVFLLTGKISRDEYDTDIKTIMPSVADDLRPVLERAMQRLPEHRYPNATEFQNAWKTVFAKRSDLKKEQLEKETKELQIFLDGRTKEFEEKEKKYKEELLNQARTIALQSDELNAKNKRLDELTQALAAVDTREKNAEALQQSLKQQIASLTADLDAQKQQSAEPRPVKQTTVVVNHQTHWGSRLVWLALLAGIGVLAYPQIKAKLQPAPVQVSADLVRTQEGEVILKRDTGFDASNQPYDLRLLGKGQCHYREQQSHLAGGLLAYRCSAETAGEQEWNLRNSHNQLVAKGRLTVEPQQLVFNPKITPANAQITFNCPQLMRSCHAWKDKPYKAGTKIPEGSYELQVSAPGYQTQTQNIRLQLPDQTSMQLNLTPLMQKAKLHVTPANSKIRVVSTKLLAQGLTAPTVTLGEQHLPLGIYELEVSAQNYQPQKVTLVVNEKQAASLTLELSLGAYRLVNQVIPANARVEHEGKVIDLSHHSFGAGKYSFVITHPDYESQTVSVEIGEGKVNQLVAVLSEKERSNSIVREQAKSLYIEPVLVDIPSGNFNMGGANGLVDRPVLRNVKVKAFRMSKFETTFDEYDAYAIATARPLPKDEGWGRGRRPVINVSWEDATAYAKWLSEKTGKKYRLPSEAEWEYAARAGTNTQYSWGYDVIDCAQARFVFTGRINGSKTCTEFNGTVEVGQFVENSFGLFDVHGNVDEWVQDCFHENLKSAPKAIRMEGKAWESGCSYEGTRVKRGGGWNSYPHELTSIARTWQMQSGYAAHDRATGFRLVQEKPENNTIKKTDKSKTHISPGFLPGF